jgi:hypothetical protein
MDGPPQAQGRISGTGYLIGVFILSFGVIFLETLFFHFLKHVSYYLVATSVVSIALLGVSLGAFAAFYLRRWTNAVLPLSALLFPLFILASLYGITFFSSQIGRFAWILIPPFLLASFVTSITFILLPAQTVYFISLLGGAAGVLAIAPALRHLGEENTVFLAAAFMFTACFPFFGVLKKRFLKVGAHAFVAAMILVLVLLSIVNHDRRVVNLPYLVRVRSGSHGLFPRLQLPGSQLLASASSLVGRIDILRYTWPGESTKTKNFDHSHMIDAVRRHPQDEYDLDPRIPKGFLQDPDVLIMGPGGEGVTKTSKNLGKGRVTAVEINPAMVEVMKGPMVGPSYNCYGGIEIHVMDGRTFISQTKRAFDIITLLNTYLG